MSTTTTEFTSLFGLHGDEVLQTDPHERLEEVWDQADPPLHPGGEVVLFEYEAQDAGRFMPDASLLIEDSKERVYDAVGDEGVDAVAWEDPALWEAAEAYVAALNRLILWKRAGRRVAYHRYVLVDAENGKWELVDVVTSPT